jgi:putative tryptophan/tyrosine transport system substrate-binding protein
LAAELVNRQVSVIVARPGTEMVAKAATTTIPIAFMTGGDPVRMGLVASLNRSGENLTGVTMFARNLEAKRIDLLHDLAPNSRALAVCGAHPQRRDAVHSSRNVALKVL